MLKAGLKLALLISSLSLAIDCLAQEITVVTKKENLVASKVSIDNAGGADSIIIATPLDDTERLNPHPIGAWFYNGKWNIFNPDHATMPAGLNTTRRKVNILVLR